MNAPIPRCLILPIVSAALAFAQTAAPSFDQYPVNTPKFSGKPAPPVLRMAEDRRFRTMIRSGAATGPDFAGRYTVVQWGCGAGCVAAVVVDAVNGTVHRAPFRT